MVVALKALPFCYNKRMNPGQVVEPGKQAKQKAATRDTQVQNNTPATELPQVEQDKQPTEEALFSWEASEYIEHDRNAMWYVAFVSITVLSAVASVVFLREWLGAVVLVLMAVAVLMFVRRPPKTLKCSLQGDGINIGDRFYPYGSFRSFSLVSDGVLQSLEFDPLKRFMPRLSVYIAPADEAKVVDVLASRLPRSDREQDAVDKLARTLKI